MASWAKLEAGSSPHRTTLAFVPPNEFEIQSVGQACPESKRLKAGSRKVDRAREGKVWVGYFHVWEATPDGQSVRRKKEKTLGSATKPKHEALNDLAEYIAEYTGEAPKQGEFISSFGELWQTFCAVQSGQWSKKTKENLQVSLQKARASDHRTAGPVK